jgi:hypothetical protein
MNLLKIHKLWIIVVYCLICLLTTYLAEQNIYTEEVFERSFAKEMSVEFSSIVWCTQKFR